MTWKRDKQGTTGPSVNNTFHAPGTRDMRFKTHKDMSVTPSRGGLAHPLSEKDMANMEEDVRRNLKCWSILEALRLGRLPSNVQLDAVLVAIIKHLPNPSSKEAATWAADTIAAVSSLRSLLETVRVVIKEKNGDQLVQDTLWLMHVESQRTVRPCGHANDDGTPPLGPCGQCRRTAEARGEAPHAIDQDLDTQVDSAAANQAEREGELAEAVRHIRTLATIFATNVDLRKAMGDMVDAARQVLRRKADDNEDSPVVVDEDEATQDADQPVDEPLDAAPAESGVQPPPETDLESEGPHVPGAWGETWDQDSDSGSDTDASSAESWEDAEEEPLPDTRRNNPKVRDFIQHFKAAINVLQSQPGFSKSMAWLIDAFTAYQTEMFAARFPGRPHPTSRMTLYSLPGMRKIFSNIITIMERFARGKSISPIQDAIQKVYEDVIGTPELRALWEDIDMLLHRIVLQHGFVNTEECAIEARALYERVEKWLDNTVYWAHWNAVMSGLSIWLGSSSIPSDVNQQLRHHNGTSTVSTWFHDDPLTRRLERDWNKLMAALFLDQRKRFAWKRGLWKDIGELVVPAIKSMGYVTFPRVEFVSPNMELVLENVNVSLANLLPTYVTLDSHEQLKMSPFPENETNCASSTYSRVRFRATQIQGEVRDAMIAVKWKKIIKIQDMALLDLVVSRHGISADIDIEISTKEDSPFVIRAKKIEFTIDEVNVETHKSKSGRDMLYHVLLWTIGVPFIKRRMTSRWALRMNETIEALNRELLIMRDQLIKMNQEAEKDARKGVATTGPTARMTRVFQARLKVWKDWKRKRDEVMERNITRLRRASLAANSSNISLASLDSDTSGASASTASADSSESHLPLPAEPGADKPRPFKKFLISSRLEECMLPGVTYDASKSLLYRRRRAEREALRASEAVSAIESTSSSVTPTTTGLRSGKGGPLWRSPIFSFTSPPQ